VTDEGVVVETGAVALDADLAVPDGAAGVVVFAHGSGSGRHSPRNRRVAAALQSSGLATLLLDLLTPDEGEVDARTAELRFDIRLLADRLAAAVDWLAEHPAAAGLPVGCFGASTGAAVALVCAAERPEQVRAVVSRGGRPDLAGAALASVRAPTLLIVGGRDHAVLDLNREAYARLSVEKAVEVVAGAGHLFEEPGALDEVTRHAARWFTVHLPKR
jgi:putative phosphoribosyl transferase